MSKTIKVKEPSTGRTYDQDGFRKRAACICVNDDESKVLLVTSRKDHSLWIVPGGGVEPEEAAAVAAVREVREEAGVSGNLGRCLGVFENAERGHRTSVYVLVVTEELDEWDESRTFGRQRQWFTAEAAVTALHKPLQSNYVKLLLPPGHHYHTQPPHPHISPIQQQPAPLHCTTTPVAGAAPDCDTSSKPCGCSADDCLGRVDSREVTDAMQNTKVRSTADLCKSGSCNSTPLDVGHMTCGDVDEASSTAVILEPLCSQDQCGVVGSPMTPASISTG